MQRQVMISLLLAATAMAQANLTGNQGLHRSENAQTLGKGVVQLGLGYETQTDGAMLQGSSFVQNGKVQTFSSDFPQVWTNTLNVNAAVGLFDRFDLGVNLPVYSDYARGMSAAGVETYGAGLGDVRANAKYRVLNGEIFDASATVYGSFPTGTTGKGFFPKSRQVLEASQFNPFTSGDYVMGAGVQADLNLNAALGWPLLLNANFAEEKALDADYGVTVVGAGLTYTACSAFDLFVEGAAEVRNSKFNNNMGINHDPLWISPGARLRFENGLALSLAMDWNATDAYGMEGDKLSYGKGLSYTALSSAPFGVSATLSWKFKAFDRDEDKDGVVDMLDQCHGTPAGISVDLTGCPVDTDKDGVADYQDQCASTPAGAKVDAQGCEIDSDKDGVVDSKDQCPSTPAGVKVTEQGCPVDSDKDGVADYMDKCPASAMGAKVDAQGCEIDSDKDGVGDSKDQCPSTPAGVQVDMNGCPVDSDKDGVADYMDKCPRTLKGVQIDAAGCPVKKNQDLTVLQGAINYKTGSAELTPASFATLDKVAALLTQISDAKMEVQGHTDNKGDAQKNMVLSQKRADNAVAYLVSKKGIAAARLTAKGYGDTVPVADNATTEGRAKNRRTELVPIQ